MEERLIEFFIKRIERLEEGLVVLNNKLDEAAKLQHQAYEYIKELEEKIKLK